MSTDWAAVDWYESPADYDLVFDVDTEQEADFLEAVFARHSRARPRRRPRALEPACGSGRLVVELARRGWRVTGVDLSPSMLGFARERLRGAGQRARLAVGDMARLDEEGGFELAHCGVSTFKYLLSEADARSHLRGVARALEPGGVYVLGFHLTDYARSSRSRERWVVERDGRRVVCNIQSWPADRPRRRERVRSRLTVEMGGEVRRSQTEWEFRTYDARQVRALLRAVPELELAACHDFRYDLAETREIDDTQDDLVLVLRRR